MIETYPVILDNKRIGTMEVEQQGLYACFTCQCSLPDDGIYTINAICGDQLLPLGVCIPENEKYKLTKKVPLKSIPKGAMTYIAVLKDSKQHTGFIPLSSSEPFAYIQELENAVFQNIGERKGIKIRFENCYPSKADHRG